MSLQTDGKIKVYLFFKGVMRFVCRWWIYVCICVHSYIYVYSAYILTYDYILCNISHAYFLFLIFVYFSLFLQK